MTPSIRIGVLISGSGTNMTAIVEACLNQAISGKVVFVGSDVPDAAGLQKAEKYGIPVFAVDYAGELRRALQTRSLSLPDDVDLDDLMAYRPAEAGVDSIQAAKRRLAARVRVEQRMLTHIEAHRFDLLVLAGYMRMLTPYFIDRINAAAAVPRIMNIHPALLPAFPGTDGYGDTFRYGCKVAGCTVHFVDYGEDTGPIIGQKSFPINPGDTLATIRSRGLTLEWQLYPECIELFAQQRLQLGKKQYRQKDGTFATRTVVEILPPRP